MKNSPSFSPRVAIALAAAQGGARGGYLLYFSHFILLLLTFIVIFGIVLAVYIGDNSPDAHFSKEIK
jgi:hypothetical protein